MKMIKSVITTFALMMAAQAANAITIVPVRVSVPIVRAPVMVARPVVSVAKPAPVVVAKTAPAVNLTKAAVPAKTTPVVADDVVASKASAVVPHTTNIAMMTASTTGSNNKCADKEKAKRYKECKSPVE
jgi:hypothetical protein